MKRNLLLTLAFVLVGGALSEPKIASTKEAPSKPQLRKLNCYICQWVDNDNICGERNFSLVPEQSGHYMVPCHTCYKQVQYAANNTVNRVLRGCGFDLATSYIPGCQYTRYEDGTFVEICACTADYCNDATLDAEKVSVVQMPQQMPTLLAEKVESPKEACECGNSNDGFVVIRSSLVIAVCLLITRAIAEVVR